MEILAIRTLLCALGTKGLIHIVSQGSYRIATCNTSGRISSFFEVLLPLNMWNAEVSMLTLPFLPAFGCDCRWDDGVHAVGNQNPAGEGHGAPVVQPAQRRRPRPTDLPRGLPRPARQ